MKNLHQEKRLGCAVNTCRSEGKFRMTNHDTDTTLSLCEKHVPTYERLGYKMRRPDLEAKPGNRYGTPGDVPW